LSETGKGKPVLAKVLTACHSAPLIARNNRHRALWRLDYWCTATWVPSPAASRGRLRRGIFPHIIERHGTAYPGILSRTRRCAALARSSTDEWPETVAQTREQGRKAEAAAPMQEVLRKAVQNCWADCPAGGRACTNTGGAERALGTRRGLELRPLVTRLKPGADYINRVGTLWYFHDGNVLW